MPDTNSDEIAKPVSREVQGKESDRSTITQRELAASARIEAELALLLSRRG